MTWKNVIRKESMARDLSETYGADYIDRLTDDAAKHKEKVILEADDDISLEIDLNERPSANTELKLGNYRGKIKQFLERVISEHRGIITRETLKIAEELGIEIYEA